MVVKARSHNRLTPQMLAFINAYLINGNASQSATIAGYSAPGVAGCRLLKNVSVRIEIDKALEKLQKKTDVTREALVENNLEIRARALQTVEVLDDEGNPTGEYRYDGATAIKANIELAKLIGAYAPVKTANLNMDVEPQESFLKRLAEEKKNGASDT